MEKTITTDTKITFKETGDKFRLTKTETGFDLTIIRLTKKNDPESYSFQEFLELYESGQIIIDGFEEADAPLVKSIINNYIHSAAIELLKADISRINSEKEELAAQITELTSKSSDLNQKNEDLFSSNEKLAEENNNLKSQNKDLQDQNAKLNKALEVIQ